MSTRSLCRSSQRRSSVSMSNKKHARCMHFTAVGHPWSAVCWCRPKHNHRPLAASRPRACARRRGALLRAREPHAAVGCRFQQSARPQSPALVSLPCRARSFFQANVPKALTGRGMPGLAQSQVAQMLTFAPTAMTAGEGYLAAGGQNGYVRACHSPWHPPPCMCCPSWAPATDLWHFHQAHLALVASGSLACTCSWMCGASRMARCCSGAPSAAASTTRSTSRTTSSVRAHALLIIPSPAWAACSSDPAETLSVISMQPSAAWEAASWDGMSAHVCRPCLKADDAKWAGGPSKAPTFLGDLQGSCACLCATMTTP